MQVDQVNLKKVTDALLSFGVSSNVIGRVSSSAVVKVAIDGVVHVEDTTAGLRDMWEETSFTLERLQRLESCVRAEQDGLRSRTVPSWHLSFAPTRTSEEFLNASCKPKVAILREEGSNGDREMSAAVHAAGFEPWDVPMADLLAGKVTLREFRGIVFVGGFSYADVLDSAKGWAGTIRFNEGLLQQVRGARPRF